MLLLDVEANVSMAQSAEDAVRLDDGGGQWDVATLAFYRMWHDDCRGYNSNRYYTEASLSLTSCVVKLCPPLGEQSK